MYTNLLRTSWSVLARPYDIWSWLVGLKFSTVVPALEKWIQEFCSLSNSQISGPANKLVPTVKQTNKSILFTLYIFFVI